MWTIEETQKVYCPVCGAHLFVGLGRVKTRVEMGKDEVICGRCAAWAALAVAGRHN